MASRAVAKLKLQFARELADVLAAEWNVDLALHLKTDVGLSDRRYQSLRMLLCKQYRDGRWQKRIWYQCPSTATVLYMPEPLVSRYVWLPVWRGYIGKYQLSCDADGK
eukprot:6172193-Pleurochrysis_carterae.AAC.1